MDRRVYIRWTETAKQALKRLPPKVRKGLFEKADELYEADPSKAYVPLKGPLAGYFRITYARYRAIYKVEEEMIANGDCFVKIDVLFVIAGIRKDRDKNDVYAIAQRLAALGILDTPLYKPGRN